MKKLVCDRCGEEVKEDTGHVLTPDVQVFSLDYLNYIDLCDGCWLNFLWWFNNASKKAVMVR